MPFLRWFYHHYFRVQTAGWHHIPPQGQVLFVGSHNGGMASPDTYMMMYDWYRRFGPERPIYGLMHSAAWNIPTFAIPAAQVGAVRAHPKMAVAALNRGASVLVYPGGAQDMFRPHTQRNCIQFAGRKGFVKLALRQKVPIIPLISYGAHDTLIVLGDFYEQLKPLQPWLPWSLDAGTGVFPIYLGLPWGIGIGPMPNFPLPIPIHTRVCAPIVFDRYGRQAARDRAYVNACYEQVYHQMQQDLDRLIDSSR